MRNNLDYSQSLITPNDRKNRKSNRTYYTIEGENDSKNAQGY